MSEPIIDPTTGEVLAVVDDDGCGRCKAYAAKAEALEGDITNMERELRSLRRRLTNTENELKRQRDESPEAEAIRRLYTYWVQKTGRNGKRTKLDERRKKAVLERLRENRDESEIRLAIDGVMLSTWHRENRVTDLEFVCRSAANLEKFRDLAERHSVSTNDV